MPSQLIVHTSTLVYRSVDTSITEASTKSPAALPSNIRYIFAVRLQPPSAIEEHGNDGRRVTAALAPNRGPNPVRLRCNDIGRRRAARDAQICSCNNVTKGDLSARSPTAAATCPRSRRARWPAPRAGRACRCSSSCWRPRASSSPRRCASTSASRAPSCSRSSRATAIRTFSGLIERYGTRKGLRHLQTRGRVDPGLHRARTTSSTASRPRCRTPTTTSWPTSRRTAPTRWCRGSPAARSRRSKLIVIGEIARDFGLYTKITGGQRIDMFGARVEQLPADLAAAGRRRHSSPATPTARRCAR